MANDWKSKIEELEGKVDMAIASAETFRNYGGILKELDDKIRLMKQDIAHLNTVSSPVYLEGKLNEVIDVVYKLQNEVTKHLVEDKAFKDRNFVQLVTYEEMRRYYKVAPIPLKNLSEELKMDISNVSRMLDYEQNKDNYALYFKVKQICLKALEKQAEEQKKKNA